MKTENPVLSVSHLKKCYGKRVALGGVSFSLNAGEFTILLGPNGAGKTTLFNLITGLFGPDEGDVRINGFEITKHPIKALEHVGIVFQQPTLDMDLSVFQNLKFHADLHGIAPEVARQRIMQEVEQLDLAGRLKDKVRELNGGHRRRIELIRAFLHQPNLILLDEPTAGLDLASRQFILEHSQRLCQQKQMTVLWASHLIEEAQNVDRIIIQHQGHFVFNGSEIALLEKTQTATIKAAFQQLTSKSKPLAH